MTHLKHGNTNISKNVDIFNKPKINGDFSIHPFYIKEKQLKNIKINMSDTISSLYQINPETINSETYFTIEYILQEINKIISEKQITEIFDYNTMTIKKATNLILTKLKTSKNIGEILLYHKIALLESESRRIKLKKESITDPLTKLYNRRMVDTRLNELINEYNRDGTEFSILLLDIDFFKNINDTFGHDMGDQVLIGISNILKNELRTSDIIARWGGEEFLVILKRSKHKIALKKAENLKKIIKSTLIKYLINSDNKGKFCLHTDKCSNEKECQNQNAMCFPKEITCSIGVATIKNINGESESKNHIIKRADSALYIAKENGRNKVCSGN